jgi:hypothetical protein
VAQRCDERRAGDPDGDADPARNVADGIGCEERLVDDEVGTSGGEPVGETRAGFGGEGDPARAGAAGAIDEDGNGAAPAEPYAA